MRNGWEKTMKRLVGPLIALLVLCPAALAQDKSTTKAVLLLNWYVYSEHAPFFLALERGYFAQEESISKSRKVGGRHPRCSRLPTTQQILATRMSPR
jgi:ABC-type nitrate/sulfonate/bicarbonate transport system substrate-binding protein